MSLTTGWWLLLAGLCGFFAHGPLSHFWYLACDNFFAGLPVRSPPFPQLDFFLASILNCVLGGG